MEFVAATFVVSIVLTVRSVIAAARGQWMPSVTLICTAVLFAGFSIYVTKSRTDALNEADRQARIREQLPEAAGEQR